MPRLAPWPVVLAAAASPLLFGLLRAFAAPSVWALCGASAEGNATAAEEPASAKAKVKRKEEEEEPYPFHPVFQGQTVLYERDDDGALLLSYRDSVLWMGCHHPNNPLEFGLEYFRAQAGLLLCTGPHTRVLLLGLGIGALPYTLRALRPSVHVDVVELDPEVIEGTTRLLPLTPDARLRIHHADAAEFVRRPECQGAYDFLLLDCFDPSGVPPAFHGREFYEDAVRCLTERGLLSVNLIGTLPEAAGIRAHLQTLLHAPAQLTGAVASNCAVFGAATPAGAAALRPATLERAALALDATGLLPYAVHPHLVRITPLDPLSAAP